MGDGAFEVTRGVDAIVEKLALGLCAISMSL
jgi:hypothetical protein